MPESINLSLWSIIWITAITLALVVIIYSLHKLRKATLFTKIFSSQGSHYLIGFIQIFTVLWYLAIMSSLIGLKLFEFLRQPIIDTHNFRITPYTFIILVSELFIVFIIRQFLLYYIRLWQEKKHINPSQTRTLVIVLELLLWSTAIFLALEFMRLPVRTVFSFVLFTVNRVKTFTVGNAISIILVFALTNWVLSVLQELFLNIGARDNDSLPRKKTMFLIFKYLIWVLIIILSLETFGVKISVLIASSAALFVGIGLGLQEIFKDLISGIFLHFEKNLKLGDIIESKGIVGEVKEMGIRTTKILTRDNIFMMIPNHQFITEPVINWSHAVQETRFSVNIGVAYGSDVMQVQKILLSCAKGHQYITSNPVPFVRFLNFSNSSLDFQLFFWTDKTFIVENIKSDIRFKIYQEFKEHNIQIPFPQQDVYIKELPKDNGKVS